MIMTLFTLRSPCSWKLLCEMYVLQFYLNFFSVVLAQLRLTLRCRCIDASTSTPPHLSTFTSSHAHIRRSTSPPHRTHTSAHLYHICTSKLSLLHICPVFLSFYISFLVSAHLHLRTLTSTDLPLHLHRSTDLYRTCTSTVMAKNMLSLIYCCSWLLLHSYMLQPCVSLALGLDPYTFLIRQI